MEGLQATGMSLIEWAQILGPLAAAVAIIIGGFYLIVGGDRGRPKAIGWFIGAALGLIIVMGAIGIAESINDNIKF